MPENPLVRWAIMDDANNFVLQPYDPTIENTFTVVSQMDGTIISENQYIIVVPHKNTKRVTIEGDWTATITESGPASGGSGSLSLVRTSGSGASVISQTFAYSAPASPGETSQLGFEIIWEDASGDWLINTETAIASPPASPSGTRFAETISVNGSAAGGGNVTTGTITLRLTIAEIEMDDGTIYTPVALVPDGYWVGDGHDVALADLTPLVPQPTMAGVKVTRRTHDQAAPLQDEFKYLELVYSGLGSVAEYQAVLTAFGVLSALQNEITITARDATLSWVRFNGTAVRPQMAVDVQWSRHFPRDVVILVKFLEIAA